METLGEEDGFAALAIHILILLEGPGQVPLEIVDGQGLGDPLVDDVGRVPLLEDGEDEDEDLCGGSR